MGLQELSLLPPWFGNFPRQQLSRGPTPALDTEQQGGVGRGGARCSSPASPTHPEGCRAAFLPIPQRVGTAASRFKVLLIHGHRHRASLDRSSEGQGQEQLRGRVPSVQGWPPGDARPPHASSPNNVPWVTLS